eukprot:3328020-Prymnesium_polylepis.1
MGRAAALSRPACGAAGECRQVGHRPHEGHRSRRRHLPPVAHAARLADEVHLPKPLGADSVAAA